MDLCWTNLLVCQGQYIYSDWQWLSSPSEWGLPYHLLSDPFNWRCWGLNLEPAACKADMRTVSLCLQFCSLYRPGWSGFSSLDSFASDDLQWNSWNAFAGKLFIKAGEDPLPSAFDPWWFIHTSKPGSGNYDAHVNQFSISKHELTDFQSFWGITNSCCCFFFWV